MIFFSNSRASDNSGPTHDERKQQIDHVIESIDVDPELSAAIEILLQRGMIGAANSATSDQIILSMNCAVERKREMALDGYPNFEG